MSTTPAPPPAATPESRPSPWLVMAVPIVFSLLALAVQWGVVGADVRNLERRQTATEDKVAVLVENKAEVKEKLGRIEERLGGMEHQLERLSAAVERLTQTRTARDLP